MLFCNIDRRMKKMYISLTASTISLGYPEGKYCLINLVSFSSRFIYISVLYKCTLYVKHIASPTLLLSPSYPLPLLLVFLFLRQFLFYFHVIILYLYLKLRNDNEKIYNICLSEISLIHLVWLSSIVFIFSVNDKISSIMEKLCCIYMLRCQTCRPKAPWSEWMHPKWWEL